jgi:hypothetical protein
VDRLCGGCEEAADFLSKTRRQDVDRLSKKRRCAVQNRRLPVENLWESE